MLRFGCTKVVIDRLDPLVNPGQIPSPHVHQIVGGNSFNATMTTGDVSKESTCTTCQFSDDHSNYWTANMYFKAKNGTYKRVPQMGNPLQFSDQFSTQTNGGILGFRMLSGDPMDRERPRNMEKQNCFRCYTGPNFGGDVGAPCQDASVDTPAFPAKACAGGIRSNILFPTCWDGKNLDSVDHKSHVAYPVDGPATFLSLGGACPSTHPVRIPQLMYEVTWDTTSFNNQADWPTDGSSPFVLSTGDGTGFGQHADYVFGWKDDSLQKAMDTSGCFGASCAGLARQSIDQAKACQVKTLVNEDVDGWLTELPGIGMEMK
ncbi:uncharacterized protein DNG_09081 [Cephalotrichum gorgonifer]|uniref:DUF1996 domain-containing protein n=1 Tax=Cephalotrichum gorgonifer TaxID=2041049 RepID=A0AAE8SZU2_9PEZI|nr:uncharacterized protein DNG_09081 [Cephalotrichum gorgonifer]